MLRSDTNCTQPASWNWKANSSTDNTAPNA